MKKYSLHDLFIHKCDVHVPIVPKCLWINFVFSGMLRKPNFVCLKDDNYNDTDLYCCILGEKKENER